MSGKRLFVSKDRASFIQAAFRIWHQSIPRVERGDAVRKHLGEEYDSTHAYAWKRTLIPPPEVLRKLYLLTGKIAFLLTREEKRRYRERGRDGPFDATDWPDLETIDLADMKTAARGTYSGSAEATKIRPSRKRTGSNTRPSNENDEIEQLRKQIRQLIRELGILAKLPPRTPRREKARRALVEPAMKLFQVATELDLEFPETFSDLLEQMSLASKVLGGKD